MQVHSSRLVSCNQSCNMSNITCSAYRRHKARLNHYLCSRCTPSFSLTVVKVVEPRLAPIKLHWNLEYKAYQKGRSVPRPKYHGAENYRLLRQSALPGVKYDIVAAGSGRAQLTSRNISVSTEPGLPEI